MRVLGAMAAWLVLLLAAGCASHRAVRCDAHLVPINAPHPKPAAEARK